MRNEDVPTMLQSTELTKIKNIPTRTLQLSLIGLIISIGTTIYFYVLGLTISAVMVGCFSFSIGIILLLQFFKAINDAHSLVIFAVCILLVISGFIEGACTGQYFYFFPLIVVVPIVVEKKGPSRTEFILTFTTVLLSFAICFYIGHTVKPIESISTRVANKILYSNAASAALTTLLFSIANIFYEKKFIKTLDTIAHLQSHEMRKSVASIIGLMDVWKSEGYHHDAEIINRLEHTVNQLDENILLVVNHTKIKV